MMPANKATQPIAMPAIALVRTNNEEDAGEMAKYSGLFRDPSVISLSISPSSKHVRFTYTASASLYILMQLGTLGAESLLYLDLITRSTRTSYSHEYFRLLEIFYASLLPSACFVGVDGPCDNANHNAFSSKIG
ncbi:hypothetical protein J1614_008829 [Plenodomus biglobosus]|nr:hypothetical protein J1614_008829 [Plenodomus biglobosus]